MGSTKSEYSSVNLKGIENLQVHKRILGPVYENEKENWTILTNK